jgi:hypothetical protein
MKRILALDPGGTTGWAMWQDKEYAREKAPWDHFTYGQLEAQQHHEDLYALLELMQTSEFTLICETFEFRQQDVEKRMGISLVSREYIGVAKLFAQQRMSSPVVLQSPGAAKGFIPDKAKNGMAANAKLKVMGLYMPGKPHAMDAMRHLIYYMVNVEGMHHLIRPWQNL